MLLIVLVCSFSTVYGQYIHGETFVTAKELPGLVNQLKSGLTGASKAAVLIRIGYGHLYKDGENKTDLDTALLYAQQARAFSEQLKHAAFSNECLLLTGMIYMEQKKMPAAKSMLPLLSDSNRLKLLICLSWFHLNTPPSAPGDHSVLDSAAYCAQTALKLASQLKLLQRAAVRLMEAVARGYSAQHLVSLAEKQYLFMEAYSDSANNPSKARILSNLCNFYTIDGNFYKALSYGISSEKALDSQSSDRDVSFVYLNLGNLYTLQEKSGQALVYYGYLLASPKKYRHHVLIYAVVNSYCGSLRNLNRAGEVMPFLQQFKQQCPVETDLDKTYYHLALADTYKAMNQFEPAEKNFLESIRYGNLVHHTTAPMYFYLGALYNEHHYYEKAMAVLKIAETGLTRENGVIVASNFSHMGRSAAGLGHYEAAYQYLAKSKTIADSIFVVSKEKHTQELEVQYQTEKNKADLLLKEEKIRSLNQNAVIMQQEARLQLAAIEQAASRRKVTALVIVSLAVIIALLCWLFWSKLRLNKVITNKNGLLQQLVKDKSWLLKEMHHRVKNNLHTIMNLLEFQSAYLQDGALDAIRNSQSRIFSMSLIHQKLYQTDEAKIIDMAYYIPELVAYLKECFSMQRNFHIDMDIDHTAFHVEEAVPLGLIINEAVTNSMKYAFTNNQQGEIWIRMKASGADEYELIIADNGTGLSEGFDIDNAPSLGFQLMKGLSEQLDARLCIANESGLKIILSGISVHRAIKVKTMEKELKEQMVLSLPENQ
jgi:two-component sensor histidine kinase